MADKVYEYMDWPRIEAVVYGEENLPREILGAHIVKKGVLIQCFFPDAKNVKVHSKKNNKNYKMQMEDEAGYFAVMLPGKDIPDYEYIVEKKDKTTIVCEDPYRFDTMLSMRDECLFCEGIDYKLYNKMGAHPMRRDGVKGVYFAIWAPNALRVSVVGDFNGWNGLAHPMHKSGKSGIYELFLPAAKPGDMYKYEIMVKGGAVFLRTDPYAMERELYPGNASVVPEGKNYSWGDAEWMKIRRNATGKTSPLSILEVNLSEWSSREEGGHLTYSELAVQVGDYAGKMGYTHIELTPVMEYTDESTKGYSTTGYFAPTSRLGKPSEFRYFVDYLHQKGIGVIMDWTPAHFPAVEEGMQRLDGTCLYEYADPKKRIHPFWGTYIFNYESPMVKNFLTTNALYWFDQYHLDGLRMDDVDAMLYLDYGRNEGNWVPNIYGSNENLAAIEVLRFIHSGIKKAYPDVMFIAQEDGLWPALTGAVDETHMGFDYKWNNGWTGSFLDYLRKDPEQRSSSHDELTAGLLYAYCEDYILTLNSRDIGSVEDLMASLPGDEQQKLSAMKAAYGYLLTNPGKKMLASEPGNAQPLEAYLAELLHVYKEQPALYRMDCNPEGFEWIQLLESDKNILTYLRKTDKKEDTILVVCNFSDTVYEKYMTGVPFAGKYKEILNSDHVKFGGSGLVNPRIKSSRKIECNERENSITIKVAPLSISIFTYR